MQQRHTYLKRRMCRQNQLEPAVAAGRLFSTLVSRRSSLQRHNTLLRACRCNEHVLPEQIDGTRLKAYLESLADTSDSLAAVVPSAEASTGV